MGSARSLDATVSGRRAVMSWGPRSVGFLIELGGMGARASVCDCALKVCGRLSPAIRRHVGARVVH